MIKAAAAATEKASVLESKITTRITQKEGSNRPRIWNEKDRNSCDGCTEEMNKK
jgi:hypothetical protein